MIVFDGFEIIGLVIIGILLIGCFFIWLWEKIINKIDRYFERRNKND